MGDQEGQLPLSMISRQLFTYEKKDLTQGQHSRTRRELITERSAEGPMVSVTRIKSHTRLLSVVAVQSLSRKIRVISVGYRLVENGEEEEV